MAVNCSVPAVSRLVELAYSSGRERKHAVVQYLHLKHHLSSCSRSNDQRGVHESRRRTIPSTLITFRYESSMVGS